MHCLKGLPRPRLTYTPVVQHSGMENMLNVRCTADICVPAAPKSCIHIMPLMAHSAAQCCTSLLCDLALVYLLAPTLAPSRMPASRLGRSLARLPAHMFQSAPPGQPRYKAFPSAHTQLPVLHVLPHAMQAGQRRVHAALCAAPA